MSTTSGEDEIAEAWDLVILEEDDEEQGGEETLTLLILVEDEEGHEDDSERDLEIIGEALPATAESMTA